MNNIEKRIKKLHQEADMIKQLILSKEESPMLVDRYNAIFSELMELEGKRFS